MRFGAMMFAEFFTRARSVEVPEHHELQTVNFVIPMEHPLEHQLRFTIGIDWPLGQFLRQHRPFRRTVSGASRAEHKVFHACLHRRVQQLMSLGYTVSTIFRGFRRYSPKLVVGSALMY